MPRSGFELRDGKDLAGISTHELWLRYVAIGGGQSEAAMEATIRGARSGDDDSLNSEYNIIAQAINEAFLDLGQDHPVAYRPTPLPAASPETEDDS